MIEVKEYKGHIRNWEALCKELGIDSTLSRDDRERAILIGAYKAWGKDMEYCADKMEIQVNNEQLENVAALKVAMENLVKKYGCQAAAIQCWNSLQDEIGIMP